MSADLSSTVLFLGVAVVLWLLWMVDRTRRDPARRGSGVGTYANVPVSHEGPDGTKDSMGTDEFLQIRPDGVLLDWRDDPGPASTPTLSVHTATDPTSRR